MAKIKYEKQTIYYRIVRETSKYNKYIKWYVKTYRDAKGTDLNSSFGYRTQREARASIQDTHCFFPMGNRRIDYTMQEIKEK